MTMAMVVMMMILQGDILRKACYQINLTPLALHYTSPSFQPNLHLQTTDLGIKTESNIQMTSETSIRKQKTQVFYLICISSRTFIFH